MDGLEGMEFGEGRAVLVGYSALYVGAPGGAALAFQRQTPPRSGEHVPSRGGHVQ
jgi:hypothetical protein